MYRKAPLVRFLGVAACAAALSGCTTVKGWFGSKEADASKPAALVDFTQSAQVSRVWSVALGEGEGRAGVGQRPVVAQGKVFAAASDSGVVALDLQSGKTLWRWNGEKKTRWSGGPGVGEGLVVAGSLDGEVVALDEASGSERWKAQVSNEVIAAPAVGNGMVFVRSNDGKVTALDAATGSKRWDWRTDLPALTVRGNAGITLGPGYVFVANDNGMMTALSAQDGSQLWQLMVAQPEGRSELARMNDLDGQPVLDDTVLYVSSFKPRTVAIEAPTGRVLWQQEHGGAGGVGLGTSRLAVADARDVVRALDRSNGAAMWQQDTLARRVLTAPAVVQDYAVVGDYDGYLHWMRLDDGQMAARVRASRQAIKAQPVVADGLLLVQDVDGQLSAWRVGQ